MMDKKRPAEGPEGLRTAVTEDSMGNFTKKLLKIAVIYLCFVILLTVVFQKVLMLSLIPSNSMADTLLPGDLVISTRYDLEPEDINRYDVLIFTLPDSDETYIKRVIGLPGEMIEIRANGKVYADGVELDDAFIKEPMEWHSDDVYEIPEGCYFFLGDNRNNSADSRYWDEYVPVENIQAKKRFILLRLSAFGFQEEE